VKLKIGPAALIAAAFIGPGTVTTCSVAGANFGHALLWALLFSILATLVLQEMSARLGLVAQKGLGQALREHYSTPIKRLLAVLLVISAIGIGNAAYQTGNILGGSMGMDVLTGWSGFHLGQVSVPIWPLVIGLAAFLGLFFGNYKFIERLLITLVVVMSLTFLITMVIVQPDLGSLFKGLLIPKMPKGSIMTIAGLIGTTVVPYNLFLHASLVQERWSGKKDLPKARSDIRVSILLGGLVSLSIVITSAAAFFGTGTEIKSGADLAIQLKPVLGNWAGILTGLGLFAAGITSAITAPLAAAYATTGILGWDKNLKSIRFRLIWIFVLLIGIVLSVLGLKPISAIVFAQAANGILLPIIAIYLLFVMNSKKIMKEYTNSLWINIAGVVVVLISILISLRTFILIL